MARCTGHPPSHPSGCAVQHVDWSVNGTVLQATCRGGETMHYEAATGRAVSRGHGAGEDGEYGALGWVCGLMGLKRGSKQTAGIRISANLGVHLARAPPPQE